jgi:hypothetical protein
MEAKRMTITESINVAKRDPEYRTGWKMIECGRCGCFAIRGESFIGDMCAHCIIGSMTKVVCEAPTVESCDARPWKFIDGIVYCRAHGRAVESLDAHNCASDTQRELTAD